MSKSVSNDALWEKLSEIEEIINKYLKEQKTPSAHEQIDIAPLLRTNKDEITDLFRKGLQGLGTHCDSHFKTMYKHIEQLEQDIEETYQVLTCICGILKESKEQPETRLASEQEPDKSYLNFKLFKVRKTTVVISILGLLVFILVLFCMKQQNDYSILNGEYYRKSIVVREMQGEVDSLRSNINPDAAVRKKK